MAELAVIDANLAISLVVATPYSEAVAALVEGWKLERLPLYAPTLWEYEVTSALRKATATSLMNDAQAMAAMERIWQLGVVCLPPDPELHRQALHWATELGQLVAYDGHYLALAERLGAPFHTADRRLAQRARDLGIAWVYAVAPS